MPSKLITDHDGVKDPAVAGWVNGKPAVLRSWGQVF